MAKRGEKRVKREIIIFLICFLLVISAVICGYVFSNKLAQSIVNEQEGAEVLDEIGTDQNEKDEAQKIESNTGATVDEYPESNESKENDSDEGDSAIVPVPIDMHPINVTFVIENDEVSDIYLEALDCVQIEMLVVHFPGDISYTMSSELYKSLTAQNVTIPQTVKFSELYKYYNDDRAYEAGRRILCEMLGMSITYYSGVPADDYYYFYTLDSEKEIQYELKEMLENAVTSWDYTLRKKYLTVYNSLREVDFWYIEAPVQKNNESTIPDISGVISQISQTGVNIWEKEK